MKIGRIRYLPICLSIFLGLFMACTPTLEPISPTREAVGVEVTAVPPTPTASSLATLITQLEQTGAIVSNEGRQPQGLFDSATGMIRLTVNDTTVRVFTFPTLAARQRISDALSPDGSSLTFTDAEGNVTTVVEMDSEAFPYFWAQDTLIIYYAGMDISTIALLTAALGSPIADGSHPYPTPTPDIALVTPTPPPMPTPDTDTLYVTQTPIFDGGAVRLQGWSPDGRFLTYFTYTQEQLDANPYPGVPGTAEGTFTLYDTATGQTCQRYTLSGSFPYEGPGNEQKFTWLPDGSFFVLTLDGQVIQANIPCGEDVNLTAVFSSPLTHIGSLSPNQTRLLLTTQNGYLLYDWQTQTITPITEIAPDDFNNLVWSPDSAYVAITLAGNYTGDRSPIGGSRVVDAASGQIVARYDWEPANALDGTFGGPEWISPTEFVVTMSLDQGPFFMNVAGEVQPLLPLFNLEFARDQMMPVAAPYVDPISGAYHILLTDFGWFDGGVPPQIYHSDSGIIEPLTVTGSFYLAPSGLISTEHGLARQITAVNEPFLPTNGNPCYAPGFTPQTPIYLRVTGHPDDLQLYALPDCRLLATVRIPAQYARQHVGGQPSPDGRWLAVVPADAAGYGRALFVMPLTFGENGS